MMVDDVGEHLAAAGGDHVIVAAAMAVRAHRAGRVAQLPAVTAALDAQFTGLRTCPEETGVLCSWQGGADTGPLHPQARAHATEGVPCS